MLHVKRFDQNLSPKDKFAVKTSLAMSSIEFAKPYIVNAISGWVRVVVGMGDDTIFGSVLTTFILKAHLG